MSELPKLRLGERLCALGLLREADAEAALAYQSVHGGRLGEVLLRMGAITVDTLWPVLAAQVGVQPLRGAELDEELLRSSQLELGAQGRRMLAQRLLMWRDGSAWCAAASDPLQADLQETVAAMNLAPVTQWHLIPEAELDTWLQRLARSAVHGERLDERQLRELAEDAPVIALVNNLIAQAVEARASDIHLEPGEREFEVRLRIDGVLHVRQRFGMDRYPAVASRVKLIAGIDIAERRLPQDGRISTRAAGAEMDVRVSSIPAVYGESIVMRLLPKRRDDLSLDNIGMREAQLALFKRWLGIPNGLVLVTGPTGSGKSTTLYSALAATNDQTRKIVTVEDPVEFRLPHVIQVQTQAEIGYTFARALRAFLRHDPDIIMVGEIRDRETAEIAIQSALTGHLVLATLHTNDAPSAITRLVDMGVEPFLVAASLRAVMAQRLVRRLCEACAVPAEAPAALSEAVLQQALIDSGGRTPAWRRAVGCTACDHTGFRGRVGVYEMMDVGAELQHAIAQQEPISRIEALAHAAGRRSLAQEGLQRVLLGQTTLDEVLRATGGQL
ncbi:MAG: GspE/PulE family protein [Burkholderiales bacterium]